MLIRRLAVLLLLFVTGCGRPGWQKEPPRGSVEMMARGESIPNPAGRCAACHAAEFTEWHASQHANANRLLDPALDDPAFVPTRTVTHGSFASTFSKDGGQYTIALRHPDGKVENFQPIGVIGIAPLRQYLIPFPGGRLQPYTMAYDTARNEWFDVFGNDDRMPDEWGYWANRGMNWNSQCAFCHMTDLQKGYDGGTDVYQTSWSVMGISCAQCHGEMSGHPQEPSAKRDAALTRKLAMDNCASCHARREEMTNEFQPGESFFEHFRPVLVDTPGVYFPDGQIHEEDFEYGSFLMSKMGHAGVTCLDCHNPHSGKTILPVENNALCMSCHAPPGRMNAVVIDPIAHTHHAAGTPGSSCVDCHMATTHYMVRDPRRDHGFNIPDPVLTRDHGIPNSCNRCHADKSVDWAIEWTDKWYGEKMNRDTRKRADIVAWIQKGSEAHVGKLAELAHAEPNPAWRASMLRLARPWVNRPDVRQLALDSLKDESPLVRSAAVSALGSLPDERGTIAPLLDDPAQMVRLDAELTLVDILHAESPKYKELVDYLKLSSDQPVGMLRLAQLATHEDRLADALDLANRAISADPFSAPFRSDRARIYNRQGRNADAVADFEKASELDPTNPDFPYSLALLHAEMGDSTNTVKQLEIAVKVAPNFVRAWYNLGLAHAQAGHLREGIDALRRAEVLAPQNPEYPFARATLHQREGDTKAAVEAANKALSIDPAFAPARQFLQQPN